ncbi:TIGR03905 family TSCPD domain-containing protein [Sporomusa sp.]|uniref:TIGR03905 family TSCPD domain-containing protein n=1 Tax=Sporomusa sp. TaxID=2078658 RepID=UPI002B92FCE0|nr:TIGR03905 family TSCPD domain-containing protein [Sporomusa sp.]HWR43837.1 TIGR03905 family TSCPD domain-containing protein [Sporomusa sp.]
MPSYTTSGVCAKKIEFMVEDGIVTKIEFQSGCSGNLQGVSRLAEGMKVEDVINKLKGIKCGDKNSSCPDQLARALAEFQAK